MLLKKTKTKHASDTDIMFFSQTNEKKINLTGALL